LKTTIILILFLSQSIFGQILNREEFERSILGTWRHAETVSVKEDGGTIKKKIYHDTLIIRKDTTFIWKTTARAITGQWYALPYPIAGPVQAWNIIFPYRKNTVLILAPKFLDDKTFQNFLPINSRKKIRSVVENWTRIE
jgi:hypothetical protein